MTVLVKGLVHIYGPPGAGKTFFALTTGADPKKTAFLDGDASKGKHIAKQVGVAHYKDLTAAGKNKTEVEYHKKVLATINDLPDGLELIVFDNPIEFFKGAHSYVALNRSLLREKWSPSGVFAGAQEWGELRKTHLPRIYSLLQEKADLVIICTHEKQQSDSTGVKTGFMEPESDPSLRTGAGLVIRLGRDTRNPENAAPVGLVIKNIGTIDKGKAIRILPERISPGTWESIGRYLKSPVGDRDLTDDEKPEGFEVNLIHGTLNPEQKRLYEWRREMALIQADSSLAEDIVSAAANYPETPPPALPAKIVSELSEAYPDLTTEKVREVLSGSGAN